MHIREWTQLTDDIHVPNQLHIQEEPLEPIKRSQKVSFTKLMCYC